MGIWKTNSPSSKDQRPRLELPRTRLEIMLEFAAAAGLLLGFYLLLTKYASLPDTIPVHFNFKGDPDSWGSKATIWIIGAASLILYSSMTLITRAPHIFNYPFSITAENAERQYRIARTFLTLLKTEIVWFFSVLISDTIRIGMGEAKQLAPAGLFAFLALLAVSVIGFFVIAYRAR